MVASLKYLASRALGVRNVRSVPWVNYRNNNKKLFKLDLMKYIRGANKNIGRVYEIQFPGKPVTYTVEFTANGNRYAWFSTRELMHRKSANVSKGIPRSRIFSRIELKEIDTKR
jgi:hypothetical protein